MPVSAAGEWLQCMLQSGSQGTDGDGGSHALALDEALADAACDASGMESAADKPISVTVRFHRHAPRPGMLAEEGGGSLCMAIKGREG